MSIPLLWNRVTRLWQPPALSWGPLILLCRCSAVRAEELPRLLHTIPIPDVSGRLDHMGIDASGHRLFVAALENNSVEVIDIAGSRWLRSLSGFSKPQGVFYASDVQKLFVANGTDGTCRVLDGRTLQEIHTEKLSLGADLVDYHWRARQLYVGHGGKDAGNSFGELAILDTNTGSRTADAEFGSRCAARVASVSSIAMSRACNNAGIA